MCQATYVQLGNPKAEETIVFLHGASMNKTAMTALACDASFNQIFIDMPGHGDSTLEASEDIYEMADYVVAQLEALMEAGKISRHITLVGYSMGGCVALAIGKKNLDFVKGLVILSSAARLEGQCPIVEYIKTVPFEDFNMEGLFANSFGSQSSPLDQEKVIGILMPNMASLLASYKDFMACGKLWMEHLETIQVPVLVIGGEEDKVVPYALSANMLEELENAKLHTLKGKGHTGVLEESEQVIGFIEAFVKGQ